MSLTTPAITEAEWQAQVVELAELCGWRWLHVRKSIGRRGGKRGWQTTTNVIGWVDLTLWNERQRRLIFVELKSESGTVSAEQEQVIGSLRAAGQTVYVWRPSDLDRVASILKGTA